MSRKKGFTLVELLTVIAIIAVLVAIAIPSFSAQLERVRATTCAANRAILMRQVTLSQLTDTPLDLDDILSGADSTIPIDQYTCPSGGTFYVQNGELKCRVHDAPKYFSDTSNYGVTTDLMAALPTYFTDLFKEIRYIPFDSTGKLTYGDKEVVLLSGTKVKRNLIQEFVAQYGLTASDIPSGLELYGAKGSSNASTSSDAQITTAVYKYSDRSHWVVLYANGDSYLLSNEFMTNFKRANFVYAQDALTDYMASHPDDTKSVQSYTP